MPETDDAAPIPLHLVAPDALDATLSDLPAEAAAWARAQGFKAGYGAALALPGPDGRLTGWLIGLGTSAERRRERFHLGAFARGALPGRYRLATPLSPSEAWEAALGWRLGRYRFERYRKPPEPTTEAVLETPEGVDPARLDAVVEGVLMTRDLVNTPANDLGPDALEAEACALGTRHGAEVRAVVGEALLAENFPLIHAVGRAAARAPRLIELAWGDPAAPLVTLVGKGVCFDTGGLNLKPESGMALMKKDMGGAATVLGLAHMVMARRLGLRLRVLIPAVENAVSGSAMRPGDIYRARNGLTVEINNTDAEGRLILADALAYAAETPGTLTIDMATLTGAARVALGGDLAPFFTDDEALAAELAAAAAEAVDPLWRMPLWPGYEGDIEPGIADLDNAPKSGLGGAITAALFLKRFAGGAVWVHFDLYAWVAAPRPGRPKGGEAQAARAVFHLLERRYGAD